MDRENQFFGHHRPKLDIIYLSVSSCRTPDIPFLTAHRRVVVALALVVSAVCMARTMNASRPCVQPHSLRAGIYLTLSSVDLEQHAPAVDIPVVHYESQAPIVETRPCARPEYSDFSSSSPLPLALWSVAQFEPRPPPSA
jgi:hypothetical protein